VFFRIHISTFEDKDLKRSGTLSNTPLTWSFKQSDLLQLGINYVGKSVTHECWVLLIHACSLCLELTLPLWPLRHPNFLWWGLSPSWLVPSQSSRHLRQSLLPFLIKSQRLFNYRSKTYISSFECLIMSLSECSESKAV